MRQRFLHNTICLNVLARDLDNAKEIYEATEGHVIIGLLSTNFTSVAGAVEELKRYDQALDGAVSLGLGGGDPNQSEMVTDICRYYQAEHVNQVFTAVGKTRVIVAQNQTWMNALVNPTTDKNRVNIATGPHSAQHKHGAVPVRTAIAMIRDMGGNALKFFPMNGLATMEQYEHIAAICAEENFALEPTGGLDVENFKEIITTALEAGVPKLIPHVYSAIIDQTTGKTRVKDVRKLYEMMQEVGAKYGE